jgi:hypothetical protein
MEIYFSLIDANRAEVIGKGIQDFHRASYLVLNMKVLDLLDWAEMVHLDEDGIKERIVCATVTKCYGIIWSLNPCRLVSRLENVPVLSGRYSQVFNAKIMFSLNQHLGDIHLFFRL